jgi:hypothetical protein
VKGELGLGLPAPQRKSGEQQKVKIWSCSSISADVAIAQGEEVKHSHRVQSARAVVEQTIADLKRAKVMESNKIATVSDFERVLDCVIGLHNLRVLLKANPRFDIPARRAAIPGEHIFKPLVAEKDVNLKIPIDAVNLALPEHRHIRGFKDFLPSAAGAIGKAMELHGDEGFFSHGENAWGEFVPGRVRASAESAGRGTGRLDREVPRGRLVQLRHAHGIL